MAEITLTPYLFFRGNAKEAMEFYKGVFGGELTIQLVDDVPKEAMPPDSNPEWQKGMVMHAELKDGDAHLFASDGPKASEKAAKIELSLGGSDEAKLSKLFNALAEGGKVTLPLAKQFWGDTFGMVSDKYGVDWMVNIATKK